MAEIAIVDDERVLVKSLQIDLRRRGHTVRPFFAARPFLDYVQSADPDVAFVDLQLPDLNGLEVLEHLVGRSRKIPTIIITAHGNVESAIQAMRAGAFDYINKPFELDEISILIERALAETRLVQEVEHHRQRAYGEAGPEKIIGRSPAMLKVMDTVKRLSGIDNTTVLLQGESGTGKDLLAKVIHNLSSRGKRQFIEVDCAAVPETLLESELFGYEKGAFTDARERKTGLVELADGGTLFLNEIGELPLSLQAKLLKFIESKRFRRVGGTTEIEVDVLLIAATNRNLDKAVAEGSFRRDLFYRLNVVPVVVPPLRERGQDIVAIAEYYLEYYAARFGKPRPALAPDAREALLAHDWPGNVRELKNLVERLVILANTSLIRRHHLPPEVQAPAAAIEPIDKARLQAGANLEALVAAFEAELIEEALRRAKGVKAEAARALGVSRYSLLRRMKRLGLEKE